MSEGDAWIAERRAHAERLYRGVETPHRSCGIALAETFGLRTAPYQSLRRGGLTGEGSCGAIAAGVLVLGEILGDPDPTGAVTAELREGTRRYRELLRARVVGDLEGSCNSRTEPLGPFTGPARQAYCTTLAGDVAEAIATVLWEAGRGPSAKGVAAPR